MTIKPEAWNKILDRVAVTDVHRRNEKASYELTEYFAGKHFATIETVADILDVKWEVAEDKIRCGLVARRLMK